MTTTTPAARTRREVQLQVKSAISRVDAQFPRLLQTNIGATCYEATSRAIDLLNAEVGGLLFAHVGKVRGEGQFTPPDWRPLRKVGLDGVEVSLSGVSHDAIWYLGPISDMPSSPRSAWGAQFDLSGGGNDGPTTIGHPGAPAGDFIDPDSPYRAANPPVFPGEWLAGVAPGAGGGGIARVEFPPRDLELEALVRLNQYYQQRGAGERGTGSGLFVDDEGIAVWFGDYLRRYATGDHAPTGADPRAQHEAALAAVLADVDAAWPK